MKRLLICLLVLLLTVPALAEAPSALRPRRDEAVEETPQVALAGVRFEGEGYESPEEAVAAYLQAKKNGDAAGMLATFAIETYVENVDAQASLWRVRAFMPGNSALPLGGDHQLQMAAAKRYAELANTLYYQWLALSWPDEYGEFGAQAVMFQDEAEVEAFRAALAANDVAPLLETLELVDFVAPAELIEVYLSPNNLKNLAQQAAAYGCDELADVVARLSVGGEEWYQCMQCARYGDKWYNIAFSGNAGNLLGIDAYSAGLAPVSAVEG